MNLKTATSLLLVSLPLASPFSTPSASLSSAQKNNLLRSTPLTFASPTEISTIAPKSSLVRNTNNYHQQRHVLYMASDAVAATSEAEGSSNDGASVTQLIFNLVKGIVGAGVLSLPAGIAAFANAPGGVIPAVSLIAIIGGLSAYGFALIGRCCAYTNTKSYRDAWSATVSPKSSWLPATAVTFKTVAACVSYSMILGDTFVSLLSTVGFASTRVPVTLGLTGIFLLPLCLMKNLSSLAPFSLVGSLGMIYTAMAMVVRYFGKAYSATGAFGADNAVALRPSFGAVGAQGAFTPSAAIFISMLSTAFMAHFNAPKFYNELKDKTLPKYYKVVSTSFAISITMFALIASIGFLTFGGNSNGLILNNYSTRDSLMNLSRIAVAVSLVFSYPLAFVGARDGVSDLLKVKNNNKTQNILTVALLASITGVALILPDVSFIMAISGATLGNGLIYVFPALMYRGAIKKKADATKGEKREVKFAMGSAVAGIIMGILGAKMALGSL